MQSLQGKVALITGANTGIGKETAKGLVRNGAHVFIACRSREKSMPVVEELNRLAGNAGRAEFLSLDLGELDSINRCADEFLARGLPLQLLILNAGLAGQQGKTPSGFELAFGTCHAGHFLLTKRLLSCLQESSPARVVVVSSKAHRHCAGIDFDALQRPTASKTGLKEYGVAKLSNILFVKELARRLEGTGVTTYALHPGVVASDVWRSVPFPLRAIMKRFMISPEEGAATSIYCATRPELAQESGRYYEKCREVEPSAISCDELLARKLWEASERWTAMT